MPPMTPWPHDVQSLSRSTVGRVARGVLCTGPRVPTTTARLTGMMVTVRVADSGRFGTVPKAKPIIARRRRGKFWAQNVVLRQN